MCSMIAAAPCESQPSQRNRRQSRLRPRPLDGSNAVASQTVSSESPKGWSIAPRKGRGRRGSLVMRPCSKMNVARSHHPARCLSPHVLAEAARCRGPSRSTLRSSVKLLSPVKRLRPRWYQHAQLFVSGREVCIMLVNRAIRPGLVRLERGGSSSGRAAARPISCAGIPAHQIEPLATRPHFKNLAALGHLLSFSLFPFLTPLCFRLFIQGRACFASRRTCQSKPSFSLLVLCNQNNQRAPS